MNITVVGSDYEKVKRFSELLAKKLTLGFVDFKSEFEKVLVSLNYSIFVENEILKVKEIHMVEELSLANDIVTCFTDDVFFSNGNYKFFNNNFIIYLNSEKTNKLENKLKKLIKNRINIEIYQEKIDFNEIINNIRGYYEG